MKSKPDWKLLRQEYISTEISIVDLAQKYDVSRRSIEARSVAERWVNQRMKINSTMTTAAERSAEEEGQRLGRSLAESSARVRRLISQDVEASARQLEKLPQENDPVGFHRR